MAAASLTSTRLPLPKRPPIPRWASWQVHLRPFLLPVHAAGGKGFGELLNQRKSKGKKHEVPATPLSSVRGFRDKRASEENDGSEAQLDSAIGNEDEPTVCPCGGGDDKLKYTHCCKPYHEGTAAAPDGLSLLRARYSAYAMRIVGYIVTTTHPENPDHGDDLLANAQATCDQLKFYKLDILDYKPISDQESTVSFRAIYGQRKKGKGDRRAMEEKSHFVREGDTWLFKDGELLNRALQVDMVSASTASNSAGNS